MTAQFATDRAQRGLDLRLVRGLMAVAVLVGLGLAVGVGYSIRSISRDAAAGDGAAARTARSTC